MFGSVLRYKLQSFGYTNVYITPEAPLDTSDNRSMSKLLFVHPIEK